jgi:hypothetical protein
VRLALRNYQDEEVVGTPGVTSAGLFQMAAQKIAPPAPPLPPREVPAAAPAPRRPRYSVEVLLGEKVTRQSIF